jgi:adenine-specific DNA-methyltransferase
MTTLDDLLDAVSESKLRSLSIVTSNRFMSKFDILVANADALDFLRTVPDDTFQLVVTSPPYNIGKPYEKRQELQDYLKWQKTIIDECVRALKPGGSLCWQVGNYVEGGEVFPLDIFFYDLVKDAPELHLRNRIIWYFEHGLHASKRLSGRYETILWFTKGNDYLFNLDNIRVPQKYPGKTYYKGKNQGKPSCNPLGKNPGDIWKILQNDWDNLLWDVPNVKSNHVEKTIHPAQYPIEIVERLVLALSNSHDIVFDPFAGVGSALLAAALHGRRAVGVDREKKYNDITLKRLSELKSGTFRYRPFWTQKHVPTGKEKVARIPKEWVVNNENYKRLFT